MSEAPVTGTQDGVVTDGPSPLRGEPETPGTGANLAAISRRIVALVKEFYGKGPTGARTYQSGDIVVVLLQGGYTAVERTLIKEGRSDAVHSQREAFQDAMQSRFRRVIEEELRRPVIAFMSARHHDPDLSAEIFILGGGEE